MRILGMILSQHPNEDVDADVVDEVAEEEELQVVTSVKQTGHQEEIVLKLSHHVTRKCNPNLRLKLSHHVTGECNPNLRLKLSHHITRECSPNLRLKLSHHVTRECNPLYHPRLKPKLYQPINPQAQAVPLPPVLPIGMCNVPLAVGQSDHPPNAQLLYGLLVPQND